MIGQFGSDQVFETLKALYDTGDREQFATLLYEKVMPVIAVQLKKSVFSIYSKQDKEDASQDALIYVFGKMDAFLHDEANNPTSTEITPYTEAQKQGWLHKTVFNGLRHSLNQVTNSYFTPSQVKGNDLTGGEKEKSRQRIEYLDSISSDTDLSLYHYTPSSELNPEETYLLKDQVQEACSGFFSLNNSPPLLASIGLVILTEYLDNAPFSLSEYVNIINGKKLGDIVLLLEESLSRHKISLNVLDPLKERISDDLSEHQIEGLTEKIISNRKNSMLTMLRKRVKEKVK